MIKKSFQYALRVYTVPTVNTNVSVEITVPVTVKMVHAFVPQDIMVLLVAKVLHSS